MEYKVQNLRFSYQKQNLFNKLHFTVEAGEFLCLMGPNGCGKSSLTQILAGFIPWQEGSIQFQGKDFQTILADKQKKQSYHQKVGVLFQNVDIQLFNRSVYEELAFGPRQMGFSQSDIQERVETCLDLLQLAHLKNRVPYHLSGGEKRKVALASILTLNPEVLLLDEPLVGLTAQSRQNLLEIFGALHQSGKTIIMTTHYYDQVKAYADSYLVFDEQHQVKKWNSQEISQNKSLQELVLKF